MDWDDQERRRFPRRPVRAQIKGHDKDLFVMDMSPEGVRLMSDFRPASDSLELRLELSGVVHKTQGSVAWIRPVGEVGHYQIGIRFRDLVPLDEVAPSQTPPLAAERGALRSLSTDELHRLQILATISGVLNESDRVDDLLEKMMEVLLHHLSAERALLLRPTAEGFQIAKFAGTQRPAFSRRVAEQVVRSSRPLLSLDATDDIRLEDSQSIKLLGTRSILCVPVVARERCLGLIYLDNSISNAFAEPELHLATIVADMAASAIDRAGYLETLAQSERALSAAHDEIHSLVELNPDGILVLGSERRVLFSNPASSHFLAGDFARINNLDLDGPANIALEIRRQDGSPGWAEVKTEPTRWADEDALLLTLRDVTDVRQKESELRHSQKMQAIGRLAGGVAHDFNNLLTAILGSCELLGVESPEDRVELQSIKDCAKRAAGLTQQLLAFSKKRVRKPVPLQLEQSLRALKNMLLRVLGEDVTISFPDSKERLPILSDEDEIGQVILNLAINARDAVESGGSIDFSLRAETQAGVDFAVLAVRDNGCGMDEATRERIFEPFFTTKPQGTGLGLSTVYGIVESCGGHIQVESTTGQGSCFSVFLPFHRSRLEKTESPGQSVLARGTGKIILVEDEHSVRHLVVRVLQRAGYEVTSFERAESALEINLDDFDLLLSDIMLPGMNGLELARRLVAKKPNLKVILMSGYSEGVLDSRGSLPEGFPFVPKPFEVSALTAKIANILKPTRRD